MSQLGFVPAGDVDTSDNEEVAGLKENAVMKVVYPPTRRVNALMPGSKRVYQTISGERDFI